MSFFRTLQHLLPSGRAWRLTVDKNLRRFFEGLAGVGEDSRVFIDGVYEDTRPETTRALDEYEDQFALPLVGLTEQQRRERLAARWKALGGQGPGYIQDTLRGAGFDVYVHEWWEPGTEPAPGVHGTPTARNPLEWLRREYTGVTLYVECGEPDALCGEPFAECGNSVEPRGYPLVNKITQTVPNFLNLCGEEGVECGEPSALCGNYDVFVDIRRNYIVPRDPEKWPYFLYIGGETFGTLAQVPPTRRDEFENLCLKICPAQQWLGMLVEYV